MDKKTSYLSMFLEESREHIQALDDELMQLEQNSENQESLQSLFRSAHTLKGMAATMEFSHMAELTHHMEDLLDALRGERLAWSEDAADLLFACSGVLRQMVDEIDGGGQDADVDVNPLVLQLTSFLSGKSHSVESSESLVSLGNLDGSHLTDQWWIDRSVPEGQRLYRLRIVPTGTCALPGARLFMALKAYAASCQVVAAHPSAAELAQGVTATEVELVVVCDLAEENLAAIGMCISEIARVEVQSVPEMVGAQTEKEKTLATGGVQPAKMGVGKEEKSGGLGARVTHRPAMNVRVSTDKLDLLFNLVTELVETKTRLESVAQQQASRDLLETAEQLSRLSRQLQDLVMQTRLMPLETVFQRFPRMVRDLAKGLGKQVEFRVEGAQTELDRAMVEELGDLLVHLLRNAIDHGIEAPEKRVALGKSAAGVVRLAAYSKGNRAVIEISDDGQGIDGTSVLQKALKQGLVSAAEADNLRLEQIYTFLFYPGFSTAQVISNVSGRGVGLDVVRSKVQSLGGEVHVESQLGKGSMFRVNLPLTLSIFEAMLVSVGSEVYAIPLDAVHQVYTQKRQDLHTLHGRPLFFVENQSMPLVFLGEAFQVPDYQSDLQQVPVLVLARDGRYAALAVDGFLGQQEIVLKTLGAYFPQEIPGISGATILGDGRVALVVNPGSFLRKE